MKELYPYRLAWGSTWLGSLQQGYSDVGGIDADPRGWLVHAVAQETAAFKLWWGRNPRGQMGRYTESFLHLSLCPGAL